MKTLMRLIVAGALAGTVALCAAVPNFSGSDDFSSTLGSGWSFGSMSGGGALTISSGLLNFTDGGVTYGQTSSANGVWMPNNGSSVADWQVQIDLALIVTPVNGQICTWNLTLTNSADATDYLQVVFLKNYMQLNPFVRGTTYTNGTMGTSGQNDVTSNVTVRASYLASTQTVILAYDSDGSAGGYSFTDLYSSPVTAWTMAPGDTFVLGIGASNFTSAAAASGTIPGTFYADNFLASGAAIPEPSVYAAGLGVIALCAAGLKRRFGQQ